jgi:hypothetical protein
MSIHPPLEVVMLSFLRRLSALALLTLAPLTAGCGPTPSAQIPAGFAAIEAGEEFAFRTANSDGVVVGVRTEDNDPRGDLAFWSSTLSRRLEKQGYAREGDARAVESRDGEKGILHVFRTDAPGRTHLYWLGVFVSDDDVFVIEAAGDAEALDPATRAKVEATIASVDLDA